MILFLYCLLCEYIFIYGLYFVYYYKNIMSSNSSQSVSCVYELLNNDNNSATWSDDGTIILNRPLASTKLDKIKFRSFSANIRSDIQNVTIPTIKTQLCARYIPYVFNDSEPYIYEMSGDIHGIYLANKSGFHLFTDGYPGYDNQTNTPYVIDDCEIAINEDINQAISDGCKYCSKQLEALLGVYSNNTDYIKDNSYYVDKSTPIASELAAIWNEIQYKNNINNNKPDVIIGFDYLDAQYRIYDYDNPYNDYKTINKYDYFMLLNSDAVISVDDNGTSYDMDNHLFYTLKGFRLANNTYVDLSKYIQNYNYNYLIKVVVNKNTDDWYSLGVLFNRSYAIDGTHDFRQSFKMSNPTNLCFMVGCANNIGLRYVVNYIKNIMSSKDFTTLSDYINNNDVYLVYSRIFSLNKSTDPMQLQEVIYDMIFSTTTGLILGLKIYYVRYYDETYKIDYNMIQYDTTGDQSDFALDIDKEFTWIFLAANNPVNNNYVYIPQKQNDKYIFVLGNEYAIGGAYKLYAVKLNNTQAISTNDKIQINPIHYIDEYSFSIANGVDNKVTKYTTNQYFNDFTIDDNAYIINNNYNSEYTKPWFYNNDLSIWCNVELVTSGTAIYKYYLKAQSKIYYRAPSTTYYPVTDQDKNSYRPIFDFDTISTLIKYNSDNNTLSTIRIPMGTYSENTFVGELEFYPRFYTEPSALTIDTENTYTTNDYSDASIIYAKYHEYNINNILYIINEDYYQKFLLLVTLNNSDLTLKLICDNYPTLNNIVFYLNETSMVDFKESLTSPMEPNIKCRIVDANGTLITPTAAKKLYSNITICMDWEFYN